jgi:predicted alpha/beta-fold hydrolase
MDPYIAPLWLPGGHLQTIYATLFARTPHVRYRRTRWDTPDGDFIDLDWVEEQDSGSMIQQSEKSPLAVLFHGLEGSSRSHYARALMCAAAERGWRGVVVHFRGCSGEPNRLARAYHSGDSAELDWIVRRLKRMHGECALFAIGVSLGGNALLKWLGETGAAAGAIVRKAVAVSAPVDLTAAGDALGRGFARAYSYNFLMTMKHKSLAKLARYPGLYDAARVRAASTLREFDECVTAPLHGFAGVDDYWTRASSKQWLRHVAVPTLMINARNDPFLPSSALPVAGDVSSSILLEQPENGGHAGFVSGPPPGNLRWLPRRILKFLGATDIEMYNQTDP